VNCSYNYNHRNNGLIIIITENFEYHSIFRNNDFIIMNINIELVIWGIYIIVIIIYISRGGDVKQVAGDSQDY